MFLYSQLSEAEKRHRWLLIIIVNIPVVQLLRSMLITIMMVAGMVLWRRRPCVRINSETTKPTSPVKYVSLSNLTNPESCDLTHTAYKGIEINFDEF